MDGRSRLSHGAMMIYKGYPERACRSLGSDLRSKRHTVGPIKKTTLTRWIPTRSPNLLAALESNLWRRFYPVKIYYPVDKIRCWPALISQYSDVGEIGMIESHSLLHLNRRGR